MNKCILVMGAPRGGTSMVAGILDRLGVYMGGTLRSPALANPRYKNDIIGGYCEAYLLGCVLDNIGREYFRTDRTPIGWWNSLKLLTDPPSVAKCYYPFIGQILAVYDRSIGRRKGPWGLKTFGLNWAMDAFIEIMERVAPDTEIKVIRINRDPFAVAASFERRRELEKMPEDTNVMNLAVGWYMFRDRALKPYIGQLPMMTITYEGILEQPEWGVETIARFCGQTPTTEAVKLVDSRWRHH